MTPDPAGPAGPGWIMPLPGDPALVSPRVPAARDRLAVHLVWEGVLVAIAAVLAGAALGSARGVHFADVVRPAGYLGLVASGLALSLRTGTPNLAVGFIASATGVLGAHLATADGWSLWAAMTMAVVIATLAGLIAGLAVALLSVPAWAATLALAALVQAASFGISGGQLIVLRVTGAYPATLWQGIFVAVSVGGAALWLVPGVRTALSATRNLGEPGRWAGPRPGLGAVAGLTGSSLLAGAGGVSMVTFLLAGDPSSGGLQLTLFALAAALIGGTSIFGRRAGLLGTVLGVVIMQTAVFLLQVNAVSPYWSQALAGGAVAAGLGVSRVLESLANALNQEHALRVAGGASHPGPPPGPAPG